MITLVRVPSVLQRGLLTAAQRRVSLGTDVGRPARSFRVTAMTSSVANPYHRLASLLRELRRAAEPAITPGHPKALKRVNGARIDLATRQVVETYVYDPHPDTLSQIERLATEWDEAEATARAESIVCGIPFSAFDSALVEARGVADRLRRLAKTGKAANQRNLITNELGNAVLRLEQLGCTFRTPRPTPTEADRGTPMRQNSNFGEIASLISTQFARPGAMAIARRMVCEALEDPNRTSIEFPDDPQRPGYLDSEDAEIASPNKTVLICAVLHAAYYRDLPTAAPEPGNLKLTTKWSVLVGRVRDQMGKSDYAAPYFAGHARRLEAILGTEIERTQPTTAATTLAPPTSRETPNGPIQPNKFAWNGKLIKLSPLLWRIADFLYTRESVEVEDLVESAWDGREPTDPTVRARITELNKAFLLAEFPISFSFRKGLIVKG